MSCFASSRSSARFFADKSVRALHLPYPVSFSLLPFAFCLLIFAFFLLPFSFFRVFSGFSSRG
ncbi:MAG: hypothetical protein D6679_09975 [Candidatus Hydrogenedentota bacterium]|nr:MAG: hypothetical protein D6679_09975 [Candidatus Hydrogenedentota bacterium]